MFSLPYQGLSVRAPLERQGRVFLDKVISKVYPNLCTPIEAPRKPGKYRVGYISSVLNRNNANRWALGWARNHGPEFETFSFNLGGQDIGSRLWERDTDHYYALQGNGQRIAEFIRSLDLDALIVTDVGCRKYDYVFFSMRLARVQCTAWGHPVTSGLPNIDYYLSSEMMEPEGAQAEYTEKLVLLPRSGLCYPRPKTSFWEHGYVRPYREFLPFMAQNIQKWTPEHDPLLKRISDRFGKPLRFMGGLDEESNKLFSERLDHSGISHFVLPPASQGAFANYLHEATVSFDPPDWSGGNTTVEALSYGVPVVTLPGPFMRGRHSLAFLQIANAPGLIAKDQEDYFDLIFDVDRQREAIRDLNADALYEDKEAIQALDRFLLNLMVEP
jgi:predicted O-linked N-acetylglucosamine transferase (SPINDLY family)